MGIFDGAEVRLLREQIAELESRHAKFVDAVQSRDVEIYRLKEAAKSREKIIVSLGDDLGARTEKTSELETQVQRLANAVQERDVEIRRLMDEAKAKEAGYKSYEGKSIEAVNRGSESLRRATETIESQEEEIQELKRTISVQKGRASSFEELSRKACDRADELEVKHLVYLAAIETHDAQVEEMRGKWQDSDLRANGLAFENGSLRKSLESRNVEVRKLREEMAALPQLEPAPVPPDDIINGSVITNREDGGYSIRGPESVFRGAWASAKTGRLHHAIALEERFAAKKELAECQEEVRHLKKQLKVFGIGATMEVAESPRVEPAPETLNGVVLEVGQRWQIGCGEYTLIHRDEGFGLVKDSWHGFQVPGETWSGFEPSMTQAFGSAHPDSKHFKLNNLATPAEPEVPGPYPGKGWRLIDQSKDRPMPGDQCWIQHGWSDGSWTGRDLRGTFVSWRHYRRKVSKDKPVLSQRNDPAYS